MKRTIFLLICVIICVTSFSQQRTFQSQYIFDGLLINPAYAGQHVQMSTTLIHRDQWINLEGAPSTQLLTSHVGVYDNKVGIGLIVARDKIGVHDDISIYGAYSYKIKTERGKLSMGLQAGVSQKTSDFTQLNIIDINDPFFSGKDTKLNPNFGAGIYYSDEVFYAGLSVPYILSNKFIDDVDGALAQITENRNYYLNMGALLPINRRGTVKIRPSTLIRAQTGSPLNIDLTAQFILHDVISLGVSYRNIEGVVSFIDLKIVDNVHLGYGYDWTVSDLNLFSNGTHEFMLNYRFRIRGVHKPVECPNYYEN